MARWMHRWNKIVTETLYWSHIIIVSVEIGFIISAGILLFQYIGSSFVSDIREMSALPTFYIIFCLFAAFYLQTNTDSVRISKLKRKIKELEHEKPL